MALGIHTEKDEDKKTHQTGIPGSPVVRTSRFHCRWRGQKKERGFPGGAVVGSLPADAGDTGSSPGLGRSHVLRSN